VMLWSMRRVSWPMQCMICQERRFRV